MTTNRTDTLAEQLEHQWNDRPTLERASTRDYTAADVVASPRQHARGAHPGHGHGREAVGAAAHHATTSTRSVPCPAARPCRW